MGIQETFILVLAAMAWVCLFTMLKGALSTFNISNNKRPDLSEFLFTSMVNPPKFD
ncbi:MAG: hypothetical protein MK033_11860 [Candidatus Caenarcaniphilales bacterium]|nr:hypothetical protein [Candidatus Caenarcaniphilales bacterium]